MTRALLLLTLCACEKAPAGDSTPDPDDTADPQTDDTGADDTGADDTGVDDTATDDSGADDSGDSGVDVPLDGFGALSGDCGVLDDELLDANPALFDGVIDFGAAAFDEALLSAGGLEIYEAGNLGGSSIHSEVFAYEVLYRCELAELLYTEAEVVYIDPGGKKTDLVVRIDGEVIGVSVTRAYLYPPDTPYTVDDAAELLDRKLADILLSTANVSEEQRWRKQILSVLAYTPEHAARLGEAWATLDPAVRADTIVIVTATEGDDEFMY